MPTYAYSIDGAHPHIEVTKDGLNYVVVERGKEMRREIAVDVDDLLYKVFGSVTSTMASNFEARNRVENEDYRKQFFQKQEDLLGILNTQWKERKNKENQTHLAFRPSAEMAHLRLAYIKLLQDNGTPREEAFEQGLRKYPVSGAT